MAKPYPYIALKIQGERIDEHRLLMQNAVGRRLKFDEVVHHINGNQKDNRPENLQILTRSQHAKLHWANGDYKISTENTPARIAARERTAKERGKRVIVANSKGDDLIIFRSVNMVVKVFGFPKSSVSKALRTGNIYSRMFFRFE